MQSMPILEECEIFKNLVHEYHAAWSPGRNPFKISNVERFYSTDADLTAYDLLHTDEVIKGWENYKAELIKIMDGLVDFSLTLTSDDVEVFLHGDIAWTTSYFRVKGMFKNGQALETIVRTSLVWRRQDQKRWLIVHEHSSVPIMA